MILLVFVVVVVGISLKSVPEITSSYNVMPITQDRANHILIKPLKNLTYLGTIRIYYITYGFHVL